METRVAQENGKFVVHSRREFDTVEDAQAFASTLFGKVDRRKIRPRKFEEFCEYTSDSTATRKRAVCKICLKLYGHIIGVTESTIHLEWSVGEPHQADNKERENNEASRHLKKNVMTSEGIKKVEDLHQMYKSDPEKYSDPAPPPPPQPLLPTSQSTFHLELDIKDGKTYQNAVNFLVLHIGILVVSMQEPATGRIDIREHAAAILKRHGTDLFGTALSLHIQDMAIIESYLCQLEQSEARDLAVVSMQKHWIQGAQKTPKNEQFFLRVRDHYDAAHGIYNQVKTLARRHYKDAEVNGIRWEPGCWLQNLENVRAKFG